MTTDTFEDQKPYALCAYIILITFSITFVALRCYVKAKIVRIWGYEDYAILVALLFNICAMTFLFLEERLSKGNYDLFKAIFTTDVAERLKYLYVINLTGNLSIIFVKLSFLLLYLRLFYQKSVRIAVWIVLIIVVLYSTWALFTNIFFCWPIDEFWSAVVPLQSDKCFDHFKIFISQSSLNTGTDFFIIILPLPGLRHLMLPRGQKVALILVFLLGGFICIASILRMLSFIRAFRDRTYILVWGGRSIGIWTAIEMNIAIICACLPPLRPLVIRIISAKSKLRNGIEWSRSFVSCRFNSSSNVTKSIDKPLRNRDDEEMHLSSDSSHQNDEGVYPLAAIPRSINNICVTTIHTINSERGSSININASPSWSDVRTTVAA